MWAFLLACTSPLEDREAYLRGDCAAIHETALAGECMAFAVRAQPASASVTCPLIKDLFWRDECWFLATDAAQNTGEAARQGCQQAGRFAGPCISNALSRELSPLAQEHDPEQLLAKLVTLLAAYHQANPQESAQRCQLKILRQQAQQGQCQAGALCQVALEAQNIRCP